MKPGDIKKEYPKTWNKFIGYCKETLKKSEELKHLADVPGEKEDDLGLLLISLQPQILTDFFDTSKTFITTTTDNGSSWWSTVNGQKTNTSADRPSALIDGYRQAFKIMENEN